MDEPRAGIDNQQAAVGVLNDVGGMKIWIHRGEEIRILRAERRAVAINDVPLHTVRIELRAKQITLILRAEARATIKQ